MSDTMTTGASRNDLSSDMNALKKDLAALRDDLAGMATSLGKEAKHRAAAARDSVQESVQSSLSSAETCVRERPLTSVLVAFGAGVLISKLLSK